jgi:hypothetical protein
VRDGGIWSPQLELHLDTMGYYTLISLPLGHGASERALEHAAQPRAMKKLKGTLKDVRAARLRTKVGDLDRTLVVVESKELLAGQKRGIAVALAKAKIELRKLEHLVKAGRIGLSALRGGSARCSAASTWPASSSPTRAAMRLRRRWRGMSTMPTESSWRGRASAAVCSAPTATRGASSASSTRFAVSGTWRRCFADQKRAASFPGGRRSSGRTARCVCTPSRQWSV